MECCWRVGILVVAERKSRKFSCGKRVSGRILSERASNFPVFVKSFRPQTKIADYIVSLFFGSPAGRWPPASLSGIPGGRPAGERAAIGLANRLLFSLFGSDSEGVCTQARARVCVSVCADVWVRGCVCGVCMCVRVCGRMGSCGWCVRVCARV